MCQTTPILVIVGDVQPGAQALEQARFNFRQHPSVRFPRAARNFILMTGKKRTPSNSTRIRRME